MNPKNLRFLSYLGITIVMIASGLYALKTWQNGDPRWYFLILSLGIALLLLYNMISVRRKR